MSRAAISSWRLSPGPQWSSPERATTTVGPLDRWVADILRTIGKPFAWVERCRFERFAQKVAVADCLLTSLDMPALVSQAAALRIDLLRDGVTPPLAVRAFALAAEGSWRILGKRPYPVQFEGGYGILQGRLIEMATGEGKTLTALLPALTMALAGIPVHVVTVNDYLARRDAEYLRPVFDLFGISVGVVTHEEEDDAKREAYRADITYCVTKDLVFDYLRDTLCNEPVASLERRQRGLYFAIVDEADGILVDEARTPLVIARERGIDQERQDAELALRLAQVLRPDHFRKEQKGRQYRLNAEGRFFLRAQGDMFGSAVASWKIPRICDERVEQALCALHGFCRGTHYVVLEGKIQIVDEFTGRILPDRSWERGLHQMIEVKEALEVTPPRETIARQTYPQFFARYLRMGGMTGTAKEIAREVKLNFGMDLVIIPPNRPCLRRFTGVRLYSSSALRWQMIAQRAVAIANDGRAVLIGTRSVQASEELSAVLATMGREHQVLNALQNQHEATIVAQAGQPHRITVATNMAGRGTDIDLDPEVRKAGGLHVILSEFHESPRIDRQLYGRAGRQGDPGSCEAMSSLDDDLFCRFAPLLVHWLRRRYDPHVEIPARFASLLQFLSQHRAEQQNAGVRRDSAHRDRAMRRAMAFSGSKT